MEGQLRIGLREGERDLAAADRRVLAMLADPVAVAVHSTVVSEELQASRERIIAARKRSAGDCAEDFTTVSAQPSPASRLPRTLLPTRSMVIPNSLNAY